MLTQTTAFATHVWAPVRWPGAHNRALAVAVLAMVAAALGSLLVDGFASVDNVLSVLRLASALCIVAAGASIVIMARGLDLSVAAMVAIAAQSTVAFMERGHPELRAIAIVTALVLAMGLFNGVLVAYLELPALFVTLATWQLFTGVARLALLDREYYGLPASSTVVHHLGRSELVGVPVPIWVAAGVLGATAFFWNRTSVGRMSRAIGDSTGTAVITGIPVRPITVLTFVLAGACAGLAALVLLGTAGGYSTSYGAGTGLLFDALAVAVIGGVSLSGGKGSVAGILAATVLIAIVVNLMVLLDFSIVQQTLAKALVLLAATSFDAVLHPRDEEAARTDAL